MTAKEYVGTKAPGDYLATDIGYNPGIYVGIIVAHDTSTRDGRLEVYIPQFGGAENQRNATVSYASPFLGSTTGPSGDPQVNSFAYTKQTYGFFMTPPDVGNQVLCCFPPGKGAVGFWFACITSNASKYMLPAYGAVPFENLDVAGFATADGQSLAPYLIPGKSYPAGEFNENNRADWVSNWVNNKRPINIPLTRQLIKQGLDSDSSRGAISSSSQRDPISSVFGFSSPGRPFPNQDPQYQTNLQQKIATGNFTANDFKVTGRVAGHSFVMDDGDIYGKNNLTRIRTAAGHQIMMNDSEGFVYISNSEGTAYIELTKNGDILVYGRKDLSIRTQGNLMLHSDHNVNIQAQNNINLKADRILTLEAQVVAATAGTALNLFGRTTQLKSQSNLGLFAGAAMVLRANGPMQLVAKPIALNGGGGGGEVAAPSRIPAYLNPDTVFTENGWTVRTNSIQSICYKIPTHEPYIRGSVSAVIQLQQEQANVINNYNDTTTTIDGEIIVTPVAPASATLEQAALGPIINPAPVSAFISQVDPGTNLGALDNDQYRAYLAQTSFGTSLGENVYGLDSAALITAGFVKPGASDDLLNPNNWIGPPAGPASYEEFVADQSSQLQAMNAYTFHNYAELQKSGLITANSSPQEIAGILSASHVAGVSAAQSWYIGQQPLGEGTGVLNILYQQGRYSQTQVPVIKSSNASKTLQGA